MLDRLGWPMIANMLNQTPGIDVPQYIQVFMDPYPPPEDEAIVNATYIKTSKKCFNCGGGCTLIFVVVGNERRTI